MEIIKEEILPLIGHIVWFINPETHNSDWCHKTDFKELVEYYKEDENIDEYYY